MTRLPSASELIPPNEGRFALGNMLVRLPEDGGGDMTPVPRNVLLRNAGVGDCWVCWEKKALLGPLEVLPLPLLLLAEACGCCVSEEM